METSIFGIFFIPSLGLHLSANSNNRDILDLLLSQGGVNVNMSSYRKTTALMVACFRGHADIVRRLSQVSGIDLNFTDSDGWTACHAAVYKECVKKNEAKMLHSCEQELLLKG